VRTVTLFCPARAAQSVLVMIDCLVVLQVLEPPNKGFGVHAVNEMLPGNETDLLGGQGSHTRFDGDL